MHTAIYDVFPFIYFFCVVSKLVDPRSVVGRRKEEKFIYRREIYFHGKCFLIDIWIIIMLQDVPLNRPHAACEKFYLH